MRDSFFTLFIWSARPQKHTGSQQPGLLRWDLPANSAGGERSARCQGEQHQHEHEEDEPCFVGNGFHKKLLFYSFYLVSPALKAHRLAAARTIEMDLSANSAGGERSARCQGEQHQHEHEEDEPCFVGNGFHERLLK